MHVIVLNCRPRSCVQDTNVRTARAKNDRLAMDKIETRVSLESCCRVHTYALQSGFARPPSPRVLFDLLEEKHETAVEVTDRRSGPRRVCRLQPECSGQPK